MLKLFCDFGCSCFLRWARVPLIHFCLPDKNLLCLLSQLYHLFFTYISLLTPLYFLQYESVVLAASRVLETSTIAIRRVINLSAVIKCFLNLSYAFNNISKTHYKRQTIFFEGDYFLSILGVGPHVSLDPSQRL